jgi:hypothetical protein
MSDQKKKIISALVTAVGAAVGIVAVMELSRRFQHGVDERYQFEPVRSHAEQRQAAQVEVTQYQDSPAK